MVDLLHEFVGKRILVVEDEYHIAEQLRQHLEAHGAAVVGPVASVNEALELIETRRVDAAILDIWLDAETAYPIASTLEQRDVPFVFVTARELEGVPEQYAKFVLGKPSSLQAIGKRLFGLRSH